MAKRSRRPVRREAPQDSKPGDSAAPLTSAASARTPRPRPRRAAQPGLLERYRTLIFGGAALVALLIVFWLFFQSGAQARYICDSLLTPGPSESLTPQPPTPSPSPTATPSPIPSITPIPSGSSSPAASVSPSATPAASPTVVPSATPRLGFTTNILGKNHVTDPNATIEYGFCPPTSGNHYAISGRGPIRAAVYPKSQEQAPGGWVHNLEHGYIVALYKCPSADDCASDAELAQMQAFFDQAPPSVNVACPKKIIVARFDDMSTRFALLAWGRAYLSNEFDLDTALTFAQQWLDHEAVPERGLC